MEYSMATALFVLGHAGSGKTKFSKEFIKMRLKSKEPWCLIDKDTCGELLSNQLMIAYGLNPNDRDSPTYKEKVRDLEYATALAIAKEQLKLDINVVLPGPWTKELKEGFPKDTVLKFIYIDVSIDKIKDRIVKRNKPRDQWKLDNWESFSKTLIKPEIIVEKNIPIINSIEFFSKIEKII